MSLTGEVIVAGLVTGTHIIEDIGISVPHKVAVHISGDLALRSKDLWIGIQQGKLFKLDGGSAFHMSPPRAPNPDTNRMAQLESENAKLRQELAVSQAREAGLQNLLAGLEAQIQGVAMAVGKLGEAPRFVQMVSPGAVAQVAQEATGVVGGEVPTFVPDRIRPDTAEAQIRPTIETTEKTNVSSAASKLRELKKQSTG